MTDVSDVVVSVEILAPFVIVEVLHLTANDFQRILVGDAQISTK